MSSKLTLRNQCGCFIFGALYPFDTKTYRKTLTMEAHLFIAQRLYPMETPRGKSFGVWRLAVPARLAEKTMEGVETSKLRIA
jgi:hypothetical protein